MQIERTSGDNMSEKETPATKTMRLSAGRMQEGYNVFVIVGNPTKGDTGPIIYRQGRKAKCLELVVWGASWKGEKDPADLVRNTATRLAEDYDVFVVVGMPMYSKEGTPDVFRKGPPEECRKILAFAHHVISTMQEE